MISANSFWDWFKVNNSQFFFLNQINNNEEKERIMNVLQEKLAEYCQSLYFEIGGHPGCKATYNRKRPFQLFGRGRSMQYPIL